MCRVTPRGGQRGAATPGGGGDLGGGDELTLGGRGERGGNEHSAASLGPASNRVVDLGKQPANEAENTGQVCRQMLKPNTNSIIIVCGTPAQWKVYRAAEARQAQELLLNMQGMRH